MQLVLNDDDALTVFWCCAMLYSRFRSKSARVSDDPDMVAEYSATADRLLPIVEALARQIAAEQEKNNP